MKSLKIKRAMWHKKQISHVSQKLVKKNSNKGPIDQFVRMKDAFKKKTSQSPEGGNKKDTKIAREENQEDGPSDIAVT